MMQMGKGREGKGGEVIIKEKEKEIRTRIGENIGIELAVSLSERLHHAVNFLSLAGQSETPQELSTFNGGVVINCQPHWRHE